LILHHPFLKIRRKELTETQKETKHEHAATKPTQYDQPGASSYVGVPTSQITEENPYGNLPNDPAGFKRIVTKGPDEFAKEDREREEKQAAEKEKEAKKK